MRNSKYLLLLAVLLSGILCVYFIGCEGDTNTYAPDLQSPDRVIGSIHGTVVDAFTNSGLDSVLVRWVSGGQIYTVYTDSTGTYVTTGELSPGEYDLRFTAGGHAIGMGTANIPDLETLRGDNPDIPSGDINWSEEHDMDLYPLNANVTGQVFTALAAPPKDNEEPKATDDPPDPVSAVGGVEIILSYTQNIDSAVYFDTTDGSGVYSFTGVPWVPTGCSLTTLPVVIGDSSYASVTVSVTLTHGGTTSQPKIFMPLDCNEVPHIMSKNYSSVIDFHYDSSMAVTFTKAMDTTSFGVTLNPVGDTAWSRSLTWTSGNQVLTINPVMTLLTDEDYELQLMGQSQDGCPLTTVNDGFTVKDGIKLLTTNFERAPGQYDSVSIDSVLRLNFDMVPVVSQLYGNLTLYDISGSDSFAVAFTSSVDGNSVILDPSDSLERDHTYRLAYYILSNVQGDYVSGSFRFYTELFDQPPGAVGGFALDTTLTPTNSIDFDDTLVYFRWNTVSLVSGGNSGYKIFAKDNNRNSDFIQIWDVAARDYLQYQNNNYVTPGGDSMFLLPAQFDYFLDDAIQTPFSGGTQVTFAIRAYNSAGDGPMSAGIPLGDVVAPDFEIDQTSGNADNTSGTTNRVVNISMDGETEYVATSNNPVFAFIEAGGDESFAPSPGDVTWEWNNSYREDLAAFITLTAGECGAGDRLVVTIWDNSGNSSADTIRLEPYIVITDPVDTTSNFEAPSFLLEWVITENLPAFSISELDYFLAFGGTVVDSQLQWTNDPTDDIRSLEDTLYSTSARVGLRDNNGGTIWWSDIFTYNGICVTGPDSTYDTLQYIYDAEGTDSTKVPITWGQAGLDSVVIWYREDGGAWQRFDSLLGSAGAYDFYAPDLGNDWDCVVRVTTLDDGEPYDTLDYEFSVVNDYITITAPVNGNDIPGGDTFSVAWTYVGDSTQNIIIEYSTNRDSTWTAIATTPNDGAYDWVVSTNTPAHADSGMLRFRDSNDSNTVASVGYFSISGITVTAPVGGEEWLVGSSENITWDTFNVAGVGFVDLFLSIDGFVTYDTIALGETNDGTYTWSVMNRPSTNAKIRIVGNDHDVVDESDLAFTICGLTVTHANGGENVAVYAGYTIRWTTVCPSTIDSVDIEISVDGGAWSEVASGIENTGLYVWEVPNTPSTNVKIRVSKKDTETCADVSDAPFTISGIIITDPDGGETVNAGTGLSHNITWDNISVLTTNVKIEYSYTGTGGTWYPVLGAGSVDPTLETFSWDLDPANDTNLPGTGTYTTCFIKIKEVSGTVEDLSDLAFDIVVP